MTRSRARMSSDSDTAQEMSNAEPRLLSLVSDVNIDITVAKDEVNEVTSVKGTATKTRGGKKKKKRKKPSEWHLYGVYGNVKKAEQEYAKRQKLREESRKNEPKVMPVCTFYHQGKCAKVCSISVDNTHKPIRTESHSLFTAVLNRSEQP